MIDDGRAAKVDDRDLAEELSGLLEEIVFDIEHGIPRKVVRGLESAGARLEALAVGDRSLGSEVATFRANLEKLFKNEGAAEQLIAHGQRIVAILKGEHGQASERPSGRR